MDNQTQMTVNLLKQTTSVSVPLDPGRTLQHFQAVELRWVSWPELQGIGVFNPTDAVRVLQEQGAVIEIMHKDMVTSNYQIHEDAPHYRYLGWHIDANSPASTSTPKSSSTSKELNLNNSAMENKGPVVEPPSTGHQTQQIAQRNSGVNNV